MKNTFHQLVLSALIPHNSPPDPDAQESGGDASLHAWCQDLPLAQVPYLVPGVPPTGEWARLIRVCGVVARVTPLNRINQYTNMSVCFLNSFCALFV